MGLEQQLEISKKTNSLENVWNTLRSKEYWADVLSGWCYYTPTHILQEALMGKDSPSIMLTRLFGLVTHAAVMRPVGKRRDYYADRWNVTTESSLVKQLGVNVSAITPVQGVVYGLMLLGSMACSGKYDWQESFNSWVLGTSLGALHAFPAGKLQDKFRKFYGIKPAIKDKEEKTSPIKS